MRCRDQCFRSVAACADPEPAYGAQDIVSIDGAVDGASGFAEMNEGRPSVFARRESGPDDPALMIYTSGTTGPPKGALHGHRVLAGIFPVFSWHMHSCSQPGDKIWTPSDWAWAGGLLNALLPALMLGVPVVSSPAQKFDPHMAFRIMAEMKGQERLHSADGAAAPEGGRQSRAQYDLVLRSIGSAGESLGRETYEWVKSALGLVPNEFYGQNECNFRALLGSASRVTKGGFIGKAVPGHTVAIIDDQGRELPAGETGQVAIRRPDPVMFLGYWNNPEATEGKFVGD